MKLIDDLTQNRFWITISSTKLKISLVNQLSEQERKKVKEEEWHVEEASMSIGRFMRQYIKVVKMHRKWG